MLPGLQTKLSAVPWLYSDNKKKKKKPSLWGEARSVNNACWLISVSSFQLPVTCREVKQMSEQYSGQMWAASQRRSQVQTRAAASERPSQNAKRWAQTLRWAAAWHYSIIYKTPDSASERRSSRPRRSTDLYPLPDSVVRGRPAVLQVVEARAFRRPVGVVLGGGGDLLRGDLPRLHAQRLHAGKICREQKTPLRSSTAQKVIMTFCSPKGTMGRLKLHCRTLGLGDLSGGNMELHETRRRTLDMGVVLHEIPILALFLSIWTNRMSIL